MQAGKLKAAVAAASEARLSASLDWPRIAEADLVIEAVFEELAVKQEVFRRIDSLARPGAAPASNTSATWTLTQSLRPPRARAT